MIYEDLKDAMGQRFLYTTDFSVPQGVHSYHFSVYWTVLFFEKGILIMQFVGYCWGESGDDGYAIICNKKDEMPENLKIIIDSYSQLT